MAGLFTRSLRSLLALAEQLEQLPSASSQPAAPPSSPGIPRFPPVSPSQVPVTPSSFSLLEVLEPGLHQPLSGLDSSRYTTALQYVEHSNVPRTVETRLGVSREFVDWLHGQHLGLTLLTCTDQHLLEYVGGHWLQNHWASQLPDGSCVASPSGLASMLSHLSTTFELVGRSSIHVSGQLYGNPAASSLLSRLKIGYTRDQFRAGYVATSAVPMDDHKVCFSLACTPVSLLSFSITFAYCLVCVICFHFVFS